MLKIKNKIIQDTILLAVMQIFLDFSAIFLNSFITRRLGTSAVGIFSLMGSFLGLAGILASGNAFLCTSRLVAEESGKSNGNPNRVLFHGIKLCTVLSVATSVLIILFSENLAVRFFGTESADSVVFAIRLMPAALVSGSLSACFKGYFNACRKASTAAIGDILEFGAKSAVIIAMTLSGNVSACQIMIISIISGNIVSLLFMLFLFARERDCKCHSTGAGTLNFRRYVKLCIPIMFGGVLTSVLSSTNDALVPICLRQSGDSQEQAFAFFGVFEAIVIPAIFFPSVIPCSLSGIVVTETARASAAENHSRIRRMTARLVWYTLIYAGISGVFLFAFGSRIGELLGGGEMAGKMISAIAPVVPFIYLEIILEAIIKGLGLQGFSSMNYLAEYIIRISVVLIFVPRLGFSGIIISYYTSNVFGNISRLVKVLRYTGTAVRDFPVLSLLNREKVVHIEQKIS
ncbi:MAG: MATE family efflux transporter [Ruminococcus flavefaciens]|nr:MATE family efflux transporter [Ruminococcus flavefaciens]MCM1230938.1 MATE family efflux transporter [Ruminococcus flavefaciens]